jgi:hypothetical protein
MAGLSVLVFHPVKREDLIGDTVWSGEGGFRLVSRAASAEQCRRVQLAAGAMDFPLDRIERSVDLFARVPPCFSEPKLCAPLPRFLPKKSFTMRAIAKF